MNWDGKFLQEAETRHDEVNSSIDVILNFGGFMYIGTILPWDQFHMPDVTGITIGKLFLLGFMILVFRRIPAIFLAYRLMPKVVKNWKEALFMGYFGPIGRSRLKSITWNATDFMPGIGAVFYVEHTRHLFPERGEASTPEEEHLLRAMIPVVYWLVVFSIIWHGLSIPALDAFYRWRGIQPIEEDEPFEERRLSVSDPLPNNSFIHPKRGSVVRHNRFSRSMHRPAVNLEDRPVSPPRSFTTVRPVSAASERRRVSDSRRMSMATDVFELRKNRGLSAKGWSRLSTDEPETAPADTAAVESPGPTPESTPGSSKGRKLSFADV